MPGLVLKADPGSFRDPTSHVAVRGDEVFRLLGDAALSDFTSFAASTLYREAQADGRLVLTEQLTAGDAHALSPGSAAVLRHETLPLISYPYEWSFSMLRDAALLQLDLLEAALQENFTTKDATPYNVQWRGTKPVFIDIGSFEPVRAGEYWYGYKQFCELFLYPLMLQAYKDVPFHAWLRGSIDGITPGQMSNLMSLRDRFRKGVLPHVVLHAKVRDQFSDTSKPDKAKPAKTSEMHLEMVNARVKSTAKKLRKLVGGMEWKAGNSEWSNYRAVNSYSDDDARQKAEFVESVATSGPHRSLVWDLGANDGAYSRIALKNADLVLAVDADHLTVDTLYRTLRQENETRIVPLLLDLASISPGIGWRGVERRPFESRAKPDLILALALVHHLAISRNVPLPQFVAWLAEQGAELVVEFPHRDDPQVERLLRRKREGIFDHYDLGPFEAALVEHFDIRQRTLLPSGTRTLYHAVPTRT